MMSVDSPFSKMVEVAENYQAAFLSERERRKELEEDVERLVEALKFFAHLADVLEEGQILNWRGVYITWEQAQAAADAVAKATGDQ